MRNGSVIGEGNRVKENKRGDAVLHTTHSSFCLHVLLLFLVILMKTGLPFEKVFFLLSSVNVLV